MEVTSKLRLQGLGGTSAVRCGGRMVQAKERAGAKTGKSMTSWTERKLTPLARAQQESLERKIEAIQGLEAGYCV